MVVKRLRRAQHDIAVDVVLEVLGRLVADAHRPMAAVAAQMVDDALREVALQADAYSGCTRCSPAVLPSASRSQRR